MPNLIPPPLVITSHVELTKWIKDNFDKYPREEIIKALEKAIKKHKSRR